MISVEDMGLIRTPYIGIYNVKLLELRESFALIRSEALRKIKERSETKDITMSLQRATSRTDDEIVHLANPIRST